MNHKEYKLLGAAHYNSLNKLEEPPLPVGNFTQETKLQSHITYIPEN